LYAQFNLYDHLCAATPILLCGKNIPGDHPTIEILNDLESASYNVNANLSRSLHTDLAQWIIQAVLRWADMLNNRLKGVAISSYNVDLLERVRRLTNKIYRKTLCIAKNGNITVFFMGQPRHMSRYQQTLHYGKLSSELLVWASVEGKILSSFTDFITTPEISGALYISPDIYHTKITEFSRFSLLSDKVDTDSTAGLWGV